jgi:putative ABC transport system permease protein
MMTRLIDTARQDLRYAIRSLLKARGFAIVVIITLGLGIGANTAVFSVLNAAVLRPLPYPAPGRLVRLYLTYNGDNSYLPGPAILEWRENSRTVDIAILQTYSAQGADLVDHGRAERVSELQVSADYFRVLDVPPIAGRGFGPDEERPRGRRHAGHL